MARVLLPIAIALVPACSFTPGAIRSDAGASDSSDGAIALDAPDAAPSNSVCYGSGLLKVCYAPDALPTGTYSPTTGFSTGVTSDCDRILTQTTGPELCVKHAASIMIGANVVFTGARPLVLVATDSITIADGAVLDVSRGAGGSGTGCTAPTPGATDTGTGSTKGAAGGGGGGFATAGGSGGDGQSTSGGGGIAGGVTALTYVRGGCPGAKGGDGQGGTGGTRGDPGGGVYLIAANTITVDGSILANGGGGAGGPIKAGGGGAGSGGLIALDAAAIAMGTNGMLVANGGGGGEGGNTISAGGMGDDASDFDKTPSGGSGTINGGNGGDGAYGTTDAGNGSSGDGGGGGGGGVGYVKIYSSAAALNDRVSPPAS